MSVRPMRCEAVAAWLGCGQLQRRRLGKGLGGKCDQRERDERGKSGKPGSHCGHLLRHDLGATAIIRPPESELK